MIRCCGSRVLRRLGRCSTTTTMQCLTTTATPTPTATTTTATPTPTATTTTATTTTTTTTTTTREIPISVQETTTGQDEGAKSSGNFGFTPPEPENETPEEPLYDGHIRTNFLQKGILTCGAAAAALLDPRRHDMVAVLGETTGYPSLTKIYECMLGDSEGRRVLLDKPRINSQTVDLDALRRLPDDTLGRAYISFLEDNKVTPDSRLPVQFVDDLELAYVMQRYREGHDLFHTILGMPTNMLGEVAVKWIEAIQTGLPMCYGAAVFGPLRFRPKQREKYVSVYLPWAMRVGRTAKMLMNVYFEERWEQSIHELREELGIESPPV